MRPVFRSIDPNLIRAARCLGARPVDVLRTVVMPGALPYIFTDLQIAMGVAWFSLVAGEMIAGEYGLGYLINTSYTTTRYPTVVIAMITLGLVGFASSEVIRLGRGSPHSTTCCSGRAPEARTIPEPAAGPRICWPGWGGRVP